MPSGDASRRRFEAMVLGAMVGRDDYDLGLAEAESAEGTGCHGTGVLALHRLVTAASGT
jgi:hypothetical protein